MSGHVIQCWGCGTRLTLGECNENDGDCLECGVEIALDDYLAQAATENEQLRAELAALKAGQGEVATKILYLILDECHYWHGRDEARRGGFATLYAAAREAAISATPPATGVIVPRELLDGCQYELASWMRDHGDDIKSRKIAEELRALLARQEVKL